MLKSLTTCDQPIYHLASLSHASLRDSFLPTFSPLGIKTVYILYCSSQWAFVVKKDDLAQELRAQTVQADCLIFIIIFFEIPLLSI